MAFATKVLGETMLTGTRALMGSPLQRSTYGDSQPSVHPETRHCSGSSRSNPLLKRDGARERLVGRPHVALIPGQGVVLERGGVRPEGTHTSVLADPGGDTIYMGAAGRHQSKAFLAPTASDGQQGDSTRSLQEES